MLRAGTVDDLDKIFPIYMHPAVNRYLSFEIMDKTSFLPIFKAKLESGTLYIYENDDGDVLATSIVKRLDGRCSHIVQLTTLATNPRFFRQGIGTKFVETLIDHLRQDPTVKRIELAAEADNPAALKFYDKIGFQAEGCFKKYYKRATENHFVDEIALAMTFD